jgi:hypothetical protein
MGYILLEPGQSLPRNTRKAVHQPRRCLVAPSVVESADLRFGFWVGMLFGIAICGFLTAIVSPMIAHW